MAKSEDWLRARLRPRDYDIREELEKLNLAPGERSDLIRDGVRIILFGTTNRKRPTLHK
jgi:hypothetical protein